MSQATSFARFPTLSRSSLEQRELLGQAQCNHGNLRSNFELAVAKAKVAQWPNGMTDQDGSCCGITGRPAVIVFP